MDREFAFHDAKQIIVVYYFVSVFLAHILSRHTTAASTIIPSIAMNEESIAVVTILEPEPAVVEPILV